MLALPCPTGSLFKMIISLLLAHTEYFCIWINLDWIESDQRAGRPDSPCRVVGICLPASSLQSAVSSSNAFPFLFCSASACTCILCVLRFGFSFPRTWLLDTWCWDLYRASAGAPWMPGWPPYLSTELSALSLQPLLPHAQWSMLFCKSKLAKAEMWRGHVSLSMVLNCCCTKTPWWCHLLRFAYIPFIPLSRLVHGLGLWVLFCQALGVGTVFKLWSTSRRMLCGDPEIVDLACICHLSLFSFDQKMFKTKGKNE